jgi:integrase
MRRYYLHTRKNVYYAALINQQTGLPLTAKSTGTANRDEALLIIAEWLKNGLPTGKQKEPRTLEHISDVKEILKACRSVELTADDAMAIAMILKNRGLLDVGISKTGPGQRSLIQFLKDFWNFDRSAYIRDKLAHGHRITRRYCHEALLIITKHWEPQFQSKPLNTINRQDIREFSLILKEEKGLAAKTINNILLQGTTALKWAYAENMIPADPAAGLTRFSGEENRRDILTEAETEALFKIKWQDKRAYIGCLLACTSGLRSGEIRAIRRGDIGESILDVSHSWSDFEGIKSPKNGEPRKVPLLPEVRGLLLELLKETPHTDIDNPFVFYSEKADKPCSAELFRRNFRKACKLVSEHPSGWFSEAEFSEGIGDLWMIKADRKGGIIGPWSEPTLANSISAEEEFEYRYKKSATKPEQPVSIDTVNRKVDVHSFRHYYASRMADKVAADKVARITGHKSKSMAEHYQAHIADGVIAELGEEAGQIFNNILQFSRKGA